MVRRASVSSGDISSSRIPWVEVKVATLRLTSMMSRYLVTAQNPDPSASSIQLTGASRRSRAKVACGTPEV